MACGVRGIAGDTVFFLERHDDRQDPDHPQVDRVVRADLPDGEPARVTDAVNTPQQLVGSGDTVAYTTSSGSGQCITAVSADGAIRANLWCHLGETPADLSVAGTTVSFTAPSAPAEGGDVEGTEACRTLLRWDATTPAEPPTIGPNEGCVRGGVATATGAVWTTGDGTADATTGTASASATDGSGPGSRSKTASNSGTASSSGTATRASATAAEEDTAGLILRGSGQAGTVVELGELTSRDLTAYGSEVLWTAGNQLMAWGPAQAEPQALAQTPAVQSVLHMPLVCSGEAAAAVVDSGDSPAADTTLFAAPGLPMPPADAVAATTDPVKARLADPKPVQDALDEDPGGAPLPRSALTAADDELAKWAGSQTDEQVAAAGEAVSRVLVAGGPAEATAFAAYEAARDGLVTELDLVSAGVADQLAEHAVETTCLRFGGIFRD